MDPISRNLIKSHRDETTTRGVQGAADGRKKVAQPDFNISARIPEPLEARTLSQKLRC